METKLCFSIVSGQIFHIQEDEVKNLGGECILLKKQPSSSCNRCYGRLYTGKHLTMQKLEGWTEAGYFIPCTKCLRQYADHDYVKERNKFDSIEMPTE